jgi:hypothetical protein
MESKNEMREQINKVRNFGKKLQENTRTDEPLVLNDHQNKEFYITEFGIDRRGEVAFSIGIEGIYVVFTEEEAIKIKDFIDKELSKVRG